MRFKQLITSLYCLSFTFNTLAATLVRTIETPVAEFEVFKIDNAEHKVFGENLSQYSEEIKTQINRAKFLYLKGSLKDAKNIFLNISKKRHQQHWAPEIQNIICHSLLRLAQIEEDRSRQKAFLNNLASYKYEYNLDNTLYPPSVIKILNDIKIKNKKQFSLLPNNSNQYDWVWINGNRYSLDSNIISISSGKKLFTFTSAAYKPNTFKLEPKELETQKLSLEPLASPDCNKPAVAASMPGSNTFKVFGREHCLQEEISKTKQGKPLKLPAAVHITKEESKFWKNKYVLIGLGLISTAMAAKIYDHNQAIKNNRPLNTTTFQTNRSF